MPLIVVTGLPASGKTTFINKLVKYFETRFEEKQSKDFKIIVHNDETLGIKHDEYRESRTEKSLRGVQMTAVKRDLTKSNIVILDSLCYIKGFRYQLFCESKNLSTTHCVIQMLAPIEICLQRNTQKPKELQWDPELIKQLEMRFEEPDNRNRWDSPLFPIIYDEKDDELPMKEIYDAIFHPTKELKPNNATLLKKANSGNYLQELDKLTQGVVNKIVEYQKFSVNGGTVIIEKGDTSQGTSDLAIELPMKMLSIAQLQRIRRSFIALNRVRAIEINRIPHMFVDYLNSSLAE